MLRDRRRSSEGASTEWRSAALDGMRYAADRDGLQLDIAQLAAAEALAEAASLLSKGGSPGVYLWGPVGRGKTWLIDAFVGALPEVRARRFHFHQFFRAFHEVLGRHRPPNAVHEALEDLIGETELLCFDELYAHETGDAQLFTVILRDLRIRRRLPMIVTSNYPPDGLLPDAKFKTSASTWEEPFVAVGHAIFEEGIELIKQSFKVVPLDNGIDYRKVAGKAFESGFRSGVYSVLATPPANDPTAKTSIDVRGRTLRAQSASAEEVVFDFVELCERPVGAGDIADLTGKFKRWTIQNVPPLSTCSPEAAQRFVNFVDVLCDADVRLNVTATVQPNDLFDVEEPPPDITRLKSRLSVLRVVESR